MKKGRGAGLVSSESFLVRSRRQTSVSKPNASETKGESLKKMGRSQGLYDATQCCPYPCKRAR
jgi:hypothetical protein